VSLIVAAATLMSQHNAHAHPAPGDRKFTCAVYGYSIELFPGWQVKDAQCAKSGTLSLVTADHASVIGLTIAGRDIAGSSFQTFVARETGPLGVPPTSITFGSQVLNGTRFDLAVFRAHTNGSAPSVSGYLVGTTQHGVQYALEGYIAGWLPDATLQNVLADMRQIYSSLQFFKGTSAIFAASAPLRSIGQDAGESFSSVVLGFIVLVVGCAVCTAAVYLVLVRRGRGRRRA
jgi:hypothetical protein